MNEGDTIAMRTAPGSLVQERHLRRFQPAQFVVDVADAIRKMMQPGLAVTEIAAQRRVVLQRLEQLDRAVAGAHADDLDALLLNALAIAHAETQTRVDRFAAGQVSDHDADVIERAVWVHTAAAGLYTENTDRKVSQISPSVHPASTASINSGMSAPPCCAARCTAAKRREARCASRRARTACTRARCSRSSAGSMRCNCGCWLVAAASTNLFTPTMTRSPSSIARCAR